MGAMRITDDERIKRIRAKQGPHLPSDELTVSLIAMQGYSDVEIEEIFHLKKGIMRIWRKMYPSFDSALKDGRTLVDAKVTAALYRNAVGYEYTHEVITKTGSIVTITETVKPETNAQRLWLSSRNSAWKQASGVTVNNNNNNVNENGVRAETKQELTSSILALIKPADFIDGECETVTD